MKYGLLYVDDDQLIADSAREMLDWESLQIATPIVAYSYDQAVEAFSRERIDILLCDIEMLGRSGLELMEWVRLVHPEVMCAFLTCHARFDYAQRAINLGVHNYLLKPVDEAELGELLAAYVKSLDAKRAAAGTDYSAVAAGAGTGAFSAVGAAEIRGGAVNAAGAAGSGEAVGADVRAAVEYIGARFAHNISRKSICNKLHVSESALSRAFNREMGLSISEYITDCRISHAIDLLETSDMPISQVSESVGYASPAYFARAFREKTGKTPNQLRSEARAALRQCL